MNKLISLIFVLVAANQSRCSPLGAESDQELEKNKKYEAFRAKYYKVYTLMSDDQDRKANYFRTLDTIEQQNQQYQRGLTNFTLKENQYSDWSKEEVNAHLNGFKPRGRDESRLIDLNKIGLDAFPDAVD